MSQLIKKITLLCMPIILTSCMAPALLITGAAVTIKKGNDARNSLSAHNSVTYKATDLKDLVSANNADQYYQIGKNYQKKHDIKMAVVAYEKALSLDSVHLDSMQRLAELYADDNQLSLAIPLLQRVVLVAPTPKNYNNLGYAYYLDRQFQQANNAFSQCIELDASYEKCNNNLAIALNDYTITTGTNPPSQLHAANADKTLTKNNTHPAEHLSISAEIDRVVLTNNQQKNIYDLSFKHAAKSESSLSNHQTIYLGIRSGGIDLSPMEQGIKRINYAYNSYISVDHGIGKIEVVNANGKKNLANAVAIKMAEAGVSNVFIRDGKRFNISKSHIQYNSKYLKDALKLNELFVESLPLYKNDNLPKNISLKIMLARDFS